MKRGVKIRQNRLCSLFHGLFNYLSALMLLATILSQQGGKFLSVSA
jgi:hypothetical protein